VNLATTDVPRFNQQCFNIGGISAQIFLRNVPRIPEHYETMPAVVIEGGSQIHDRNEDLAKRDLADCDLIPPMKRPMLPQQNV
jgi:hypothetical protein